MGMTIGYPVDLHLHSACSDGLYSPKELCGMADRLNLDCIALCDHDTVSGLAQTLEEAERINGLRRERGNGQRLLVLPSLELSTGPEGRTHVLGYGVNPQSPELQRLLRDAAEDRQSRAAEMIRRLTAQGITFPPDVLASLRRPGVGRAHIARALVMAGAAGSVRQAFERYLLEGKSAYVSRKRLHTAEAIRLLRGAGAIPVLAHPGKLPLEGSALLMLIEAFVGQGLMGLEAYHPSASKAQARQMDGFAREMGLLVTGGSDFHGDPDTRVRMAHMPGGWTSLREDVEALLSACGLPS